MEKRIILLYFPSKTIVEYITKHPIDWSDKELARRGGDGDRTGIPPTPFVQEFLMLLAARKALFTQEEYWQHCADAWCDWLNERKAHFATWHVTSRPRIPEGLRAKAYRNFYPAMIDALHVWSMLCETGVFYSCFLDSYEDATGKSDITVTSNGNGYKIALVGPTFNAANDRKYKVECRPGYEDAEKSIVKRIPLERARQPGNKRWYTLDDFSDLITNVAAPQHPECATMTQQRSLFYGPSAYDMGA